MEANVVNRLAESISTDSNVSKKDVANALWAAVHPEREEWGNKPKDVGKATQEDIDTYLDGLKKKAISQEILDSCEKLLKIFTRL